MPSDRVARLVDQMTLDQKIAQLSGAWLSVGAGGEVAPYQGNLAAGEPVPVAERLAHGAGQLTRPFGSAPLEPSVGVASLADLQRRLADAGLVPAMVHEECLSGFMAHGATAFPVPLNWGSCWDPELVREMGAAIGAQMRSVGVHQGLAPLLDVVRDARWGRVEECIGEDPYLVGVIGSAYIAGLQSPGPDGQPGVLATAKHFVGYSFSEGGRNLAPAHVGPRELADVFLLPFEMAVTGSGVGSVMNAYQEIDSEPVAASRHLLTEVLREQWGFDGIVVSDYYSVGFLQSLHGVAADAAEAAALALRAGIDVELPERLCYGEPLAEALRRGLVTEADIDLAVTRVLAAKEPVGLLDGTAGPSGASAALDAAADRRLARRVAEASIVLLQNNGVLPLDAPGAGVALIGPNASSGAGLLGNYSFQNHVAAQVSGAPDGVAVVTVEAALREALGDRLTVERGCEVVGEDRSGFDAAARAATEAEVAVVVVGDQAGNFGRGTSGEGTDRDDLCLPGLQHQLIAAVVATGTPTVVVLVCGRPYDLSWVAEHAAAVVLAWFPGEEGGRAIADVLLGRAEPAGRTPVTFSRGAGQQPLNYDSKRLSRTGYSRSSTRPVFCFGHGLSYTTFTYRDLVVDEEVAVDGVMRAAVTVTNTGDRHGNEVVQLYVSDPVASVTRPVQQLKGFARVALAPGESKRATFHVPTDLLAFTGPDLTRIVEPGALWVRIGASSEDLRAEAAIQMVGDTRVVPPPRRLFTAVDVSAI